jgi:hypothetical protein
MDKALLKKAADELDRFLSKYDATDPLAAALRKGQLSKLIDDARHERIIAPLEWQDVPGGYPISEGAWRQYPNLEHAYAVFKIEITGGETPAWREIRENDRLKRTSEPNKNS